MDTEIKNVLALNGIALNGLGQVAQIKFSDGSILTTAGATTSPSAHIYNGVHTASQCSAAAGSVQSIGGTDNLCIFTGASCPAGWTRLNNWGITTSNSASYTCQCNSC